MCLCNHLFGCEIERLVLFGGCFSHVLRKRRIFRFFPVKYLGLRANYILFDRRIFRFGKRLGLFRCLGFLKGFLFHLGLLEDLFVLARLCGRGRILLHEATHIGHCLFIRLVLFLTKHNLRCFGRGL